MTNEPILKSARELGWASAKKIALNASWSVESTQKAIEELVAEGKLLKRNRGRGHQYGLPEGETNPEPIPEPVEDLPDPSTMSFTTLDEFMFGGVKYLPRGEALSATEFAQELLKVFPNMKYKPAEVVNNLGKLVRLNKVTLRPKITEDNGLIYTFVRK